MLAARFAPVRATQARPRWPLRPHSSGRYLVDAQGVPFYLHGDTPWSLAVQCTPAQIDTYLDTRARQGFTALLLNAIERYYSSQIPAYRNASGVDPFSTLGNFAAPVEAYWQRLDAIVSGAAARNMVCLVAPAYLGYGGGAEGWTAEVSAESDVDLQAYGAFLAARYTQGNVVWVMGGDYAGNATERAKQWQIATGLRSVRNTDLITGHAQRAQDPYTLWGSSYEGYNLNNVYSPTDGVHYDACATAWSRGLPFVMIEAGYEGEVALADVRRAAYQALCSGACGGFFGCNPVWGFGEPNANGGAGAAAVIAGQLGSAGATQMSYLRALLDAYAWWKLTPSSGSALVTSALGGGAARVCPALASDGSFAWVWSPGVNVTVNLAAFTPTSVRARLFDPTTGGFAAVGGSPFVNSGTQTITISAERVLVLDAG